MRQRNAQRVPLKYEPSRIMEILTSIETQLNNLSEGKLSGRYLTDTGTPSSSVITGALGDIIWDSAPTIVGSVSGNSILRLGWVCTVPGTPGTWKDYRILTS